MYKYLPVIWLMMLFAFSASAQKPDTTTRSPATKNSKDTLISTRQDTLIRREFKPKPKKEKVFHPDTLHSPHLATIRSLMVPGWGQIYNHRWWKVPVIYASLALLGDAIVFNTTYYNEFLALSKYREYGTVPAPTAKYYNQYNLYANEPSQALYDALDEYTRDRDLCILGVFAVWGINVIDAYIDAKFQSIYTVDNNFSMRLTPVLLNQQTFTLNLNGYFIPGLKFTFAF